MRGCRAGWPSNHCQRRAAPVTECVYQGSQRALSAAEAYVHQLRNAQRVESQGVIQAS